ncbi:hypothetical protein C8Q73DRAFT_669951 [Cubamyces lactineus]|nr:hypothetical protein C8Q73DRAFT_669951 [Cubamyces lactineus]
MAQQSVLLNVDILDEIFQWFDYEVTHGHPLVDLVSFTCYRAPRDAEVDRRRSLTSAARVCSAFHEPALRVLWRQLESLLPLFSLIGRFFAKVQENAEQTYGGSSGDAYHLPDHLHGQTSSISDQYLRKLYLTSHRLTMD